MSVPAGWYPDPQDHTQVRYWDGTIWTENRAPAQPAAGAPTGAPPSSYGTAPAPGAAEQTTPYGAVGYGSGAAAPTPGGGAPGTAGAYGTPPPASSSNGGKVALAIVLGVAALVVVLVVVFAVRLIGDLGSGPDPTTAPTQPVPTASNEPTDDPTTAAPSDADGGTIVSGDVADVQVPEGAAMTFTFVVDEAGVYWLDTYSDEDVDPLIEVTGANGTQWRNDDGATESSNSYDASLTMVLAAGEHEVVVEDLADSGTSFELHAGGEPAPAIEAGEHEFSVEEGGTWVGQLDVAAGQTITVDVHDTGDDDAIAGIGLVDGTYEENDDRSGDAPETDNSYDPYVTVESSQDGAAIVMVWGYTDEAVSGTVTVVVE